MASRDGKLYPPAIRCARVPACAAIAYVDMALGLLRRSHPHQSPAISFTGGLGAQMLSAAGYFRLEMDGATPEADLNYFDVPPRIAAPGSGEVSIWPWQLKPFGIAPEGFWRLAGRVSRNRVLRDSPQKTALGIQGLRTPEIRARFEVPRGVREVLPPEFPQRFAAVHLRRGDYLNVASHVVPDEAFVSALLTYAQDLEAVVLLSDGEPGATARARLEGTFRHFWVPERLSAWDTHRVLLASAMMIGSNSQFSLVAALLHESGRVLLPSRWAGRPVDQAAWEAEVTGLCAFRAM